MRLYLVTTDTNYPQYYVVKAEGVGQAYRLVYQVTLEDELEVEEFNQEHTLWQQYCNPLYDSGFQRLNLH